jgi:putative transposase
MESWERNWEELSAYFEYTEPIKRIIYTTNAVEGFYRQVRKINQNKRCFHQCHGTTKTSLSCYKKY